jgi:hypothetical protein
MARTRSSRHGAGSRSAREVKQAARSKRRRGRSASTAAGEYVHEEIRHVRKGKHGAANRKQAIAIGLSKARRSGVPVKKKKGGST